MPNFSMQQAGEPTLEQMSVIGAGLRAHHAAAGHERVEDVFSIFAYDSNHTLIGAFVGSCLRQRVYIRQLWVAESARKHGIGSKLLSQGEAEAIKRGCRNAHTDTFSWQAPEFYLKRRYVQYGILNDFPTGSALHYVTKSLVG